MIRCVAIPVSTNTNTKGEKARLHRTPFVLPMYSLILYYTSLYFACLSLVFHTHFTVLRLKLWSTSGVRAEYERSTSGVRVEYSGVRVEYEWSTHSWSLAFSPLVETQGHRERISWIMLIGERRPDCRDFIGRSIVLNAVQKALALDINSFCFKRRSL
jgi:hypothetical protein